MKKITLLIAGIVLLTTNILSADNDASDINIIGINPISLYFKVFTGHYGMITNRGAREIYVPVTAIISKNASFLYPALSYRFYINKKGRGKFWGPFLGLPLMYSQKLNTYALGIEPGVEVGYRWIFKYGITIAPTIGTGFALIKGGSFKEDIALYDKSVTIKLRLGLGYIL
jgi:hypothetical protein